MGGGIGALILLLVALAAAMTVLLLTLNARGKSAGQILQEARVNIVGATALVLIGLTALALAAFVIWELL